MKDHAPLLASWDSRLSPLEFTSPRTAIVPLLPSQGLSHDDLVLESPVYALFNELFKIFSLVDLFQHVPDIIVIVYIDLLLEMRHVILQPGAFISRLII